MVVFTCDACGESLKKAQVEKHVLKCHACQVLSCIDCGKDFWGEDYRNHNKCISEDQKYGGKDFQAKANKGEVKQLQWIQRIHEAMDRPDIDPKLRQVLDQVSSYENVPRKRAKFQNWMKNSLKIHGSALVEQVWEIFSSAVSNDKTQNNHSQNKLECSTENQTNINNGPNESRREQKVRSDENSDQNGHNTCEKQTRKKRKRQTEESNEKTTKKKYKKSKQEEFDESLNPEGEEPANEEEEFDSNPKGKFNWKGTIKAVLRDAPEDGLAIKKLRKKVLAAYYSFSGDSNYRSEDEIYSLFNKKINNNPKFKVLKDKVRLVK
nr:cell growth-regulating nucleolar protein [Misgurnus anguillicaudatus]XP_055033602.1 cell growth-regulating nucleolar protein [Misgurnus anguillicaudatus]